MKTQITKSWRKSLSLRFDTHGVLQVKAPKFMLQYQIDAFLQKNAAWIEKHHTKIQKQKEEKKWYLFGEEIALPITSGHPPLLRKATAPSALRAPTPGHPSLEQSSIHLDPSPKEAYKFPLVEGDTCEAGGGGNTTKRVKFYQSQAKNYIVLRCEALAKKHGFSYVGIKITSAATRWGSCTSKKTLNFSYRLVMSPKECIDYVIIHELCHLRQMNHSRNFWKEVATIMPEYKDYEKHLKSEGWRYKV